ncbi:putative bifunctional diguanylate cyclase/phosphodiesterase [Lichenifustis flavocetrariae]|uniref:EAL domain-containing protein n=1 Tax=Lichenifustis flavocetrariae TaxID=2949735 RepID=A0AA41Z396_9HYPH|nr:EAL domain-containing protein [Lichenifustis flavocetrariae]MCW6512924.1 EAL domain-containing protein [Lichenifustis flavocetrariae]
MTVRRRGETKPLSIAAHTPPVSDQEQASQAEVNHWKKKAEQVERLVKLGSFELEFDTGLLSWSDGTYAIFGLPPGTPITVAQAIEFYDIETQALIADRIEIAKQSGEPYDLTVPFQARGGRTGWARMIAQVETINGSARLFGVIRDISRERDAEERLRQQAHGDVLTGLPNRRAFQLYLDQVFEEVRQGAAMALCIIDVDHFKMTNDLHGHAVGDKLLQAIGHRLSATVRTIDFVARLGGDEFAVVLHGVRDKAELRQRASGIVEAARQPLTADQIVVEPSISVGACLLGPKVKGLDAALRQADIALYKAKLNGRDQFCLFQPSFRREVDDHGRLLDEVGIGLARNQFEVHYQPIVDLRTQIVRGWEALVRWRHPTKGLLAPARFMAALMDPKASVAIDDFVLAKSLLQMRQWLDGGIPVTCAGVNVSDAQLKRPDLVPTIMSLLQANDLTPDRLKIEVLETAFVGQATKSVAATIDRLARLGVVSALDDFGTGHASLIHLKQFRVERIKIDRSFVANLGKNGYDQAIVRCMIALGRDLGIRITAEGIETVEQLEILRRLGCDCGQGYLFGRPMHPDDVPDFLVRWHDGAAASLLGQADAVTRSSLRVV